MEVLVGPFCLLWTVLEVPGRPFCLFRTVLEVLGRPFCLFWTVLEVLGETFLPVFFTVLEVLGEAFLPLSAVLEVLGEVFLPLVISSGGPRRGRSASFNSLERSKGKREAYTPRREEEGVPRRILGGYAGYLQRGV